MMALSHLTKLVLLTERSKLEMSHASMSELNISLMLTFLKLLKSIIYAPVFDMFLGKTYEILFSEID